MNNVERRFLPMNAFEVRMEGEGEQKLLVGYAAVFYREGDAATQYEMWPGYIERFMPGAFDETLLNDDIRCLFNHNPDYLLGRNKSGTLELSVDSKGLLFRCQLPDTQWGRDTRESLNRKDLSGSSIGFTSERRTYREVDGDVVIREVEKARLFDVGPVTYPAYAGTEAALRSADTARRDVQEFIASKRRTMRREVKRRGLQLGIRS